MPSLDEMLEFFLEEARIEADGYVIGEDISPVPELKIIFDGFAEDDNGDDDQSSESYAIFIHKDAMKKGFAFPKHDDTPWTVVHRPNEEICLSAWYNNEECYWTLPEDWSVAINSKNLTVKQFEDILSKLYIRYSD